MRTPGLGGQRQGGCQRLRRALCARSGPATARPQRSRPGTTWAHPRESRARAPGGGLPARPGAESRRRGLPWEKVSERVRIQTRRLSMLPAARRAGAPSWRPSAGRGREEGAGPEPAPGPAHARAHAHTHSQPRAQPRAHKLTSLPCAPLRPRPPAVAPALPASPAPTVPPSPRPGPLPPGAAARPARALRGSSALGSSGPSPPSPPLLKSPPLALPRPSGPRRARTPLAGTEMPAARDLGGPRTGHRAPPVTHTQPGAHAAEGATGCGGGWARTCPWAGGWP